jgi:hypothetical protein
LKQNSLPLVSEFAACHAASTPQVAATDDIDCLFFALLLYKWYAEPGALPPTMKVRTCVIQAFLILICSIAAFGQNNVKKEQDVSDVQKRQVQELAHRFINRFQQTRDLNPLIPELFSGEFKSCFREGFSRNTALNGRNISYDMFFRGFVVTLNFHYIQIADFIYYYDVPTQDPSKNVSIRILPSRILNKAKSPEELFNLVHPEEYRNRESYLKALHKAEQIFVESREYLRNRNYEGSARFQKNLKAVSVDFQGNPNSWFVSSGRGPFSCLDRASAGRVFSVTTPMQLNLYIIEKKGRYRIGMIDTED